MRTFRLIAIAAILAVSSGAYSGPIEDAESVAQTISCVEGDKHLISHDGKKWCFVKLNFDGTLISVAVYLQDGNPFGGMKRLPPQMSSR